MTSPAFAYPITQWDYKSFITSYIGIPVFIVLCLGYKLIYRTRFVSADTMDLQTDAREFDEAELRGDDEDEMKRAEQGAPIWRRAWIAAKKW